MLKEFSLMGDVKNEIENAIKVLGLSQNHFRLLDDVAGKETFTDVLNHFVKPGACRWWWEEFKQPSFLFREVENPFEHLTDIIPETDGNVWLIVEDDEESFYPVYDARPEFIKNILDECFAFEYYVVDKNKEWLLCENHHNSFIGVGNKLREHNAGRLIE
jgi:hypothetical protein